MSSSENQRSLLQHHHHHQLPPARDQQIESSIVFDGAKTERVSRSVCITSLMIDYCDVSGELLAFIDSHAIAALCAALRFNKRACHVLEGERRWLDLLRLQCGVVRSTDGKGYVWSNKTDRAGESESESESESEEQARDAMVVRPTVRAFGCGALVDFLSLRSQIHHLTQDVHIVAGDVKTIARVDGREVDLRVIPHDLTQYFCGVPGVLGVCFPRIRYTEYMCTLREIAKNKRAKCVLIAPSRASGAVLTPELEARAALQAARDTIVTRDFDKKVVFQFPDKSTTRAFAEAYEELLGDELRYRAEIPEDDDLRF